MKNQSVNFEGTDYMLLDIHRENLKLDDISCDLCGKTKLSDFWQFGTISVTKRSYKLCNDCHEVVTK